MIRAIKTIAINGVEVTMLFTPRLFVMADEKGIAINFKGQSLMQNLATYADICYCAALNHWTLDNDIEDFKLERKDFHEWSTLNQVEFGKVMTMAVEALSGKTMREIAKEQQEAKDAGEDVKKKKPKKSGVIIRILRRFWSAIVG